MKIVHISPYFPSVSSYHAGGIVMGHEIEALRLFCDVRALSFISRKRDRELSLLNGEVKTVRISWLTRALSIAIHPYLPSYFAARTSLRFRRMLFRELRETGADTVYAEYLQMGQYIGLKRHFPDKAFHLVAHDVCSQSYERRLKDAGGLKKVILKWELKKIRKYEKLYFSQADRILTFSLKDKRLIEEISGRKDIELIHAYTGIPDEDLSRPVDQSKKEDGSILFLGQMSRAENAEAALRLIRISERIRESYPELRLYIVGNAPGEELKKLASEREWITLTGYVENVDTYIKRASVAVFPLTMGAGIKVKVLYCMAQGVPVITSDIGAEGIDEEGTLIRLAGTDEDFVAATLSLLFDPEGSRELGVKSHEFIADNFSWSETVEMFRRLYT